MLGHLAYSAFSYAFEFWLLTAGAGVVVALGWWRRALRRRRWTRAAARYLRERQWSAEELAWLDFERHHR